MTTLRASYIRAYSVGLTNTCASQYAIAVIRVMYIKKIYISDIKALVSDACYYIKNKAISRFW